MMLIGISFLCKKWRLGLDADTEKTEKWQIFHQMILVYPGIYIRLNILKELLKKSTWWCHYRLEDWFKANQSYFQQFLVNNSQFNAQLCNTNKKLSFNKPFSTLQLLPAVRTWKARLDDKFHSVYHTSAPPIHFGSSGNSAHRISSDWLVPNTW